MKHSRVASEGAFPAIVKSSLWGKQDLALVTTKTDRQAVKIADYLHVYSSASLSRHSLTGKSTAQTLKAEDNKPTSLHSSRKVSTDQLLSPKPPSGRGHEKNQLKKEAEELGYEVTKAVSDRLELLRDLSTYEHLFSTATDLSSRLLLLRSHASQLPTIFQHLSTLLNTERFSYSQIQSGLQEIARNPHPPVQSKPTDVPIHTSLELRSISDAFRSRLLYSGAIVISNLPCLITVSGDGLFRNLKITVQTLSGALFRMTIQQDLLSKQNLTTARQIKLAIKAMILPRLHFTVERNAMKLHFDPDCGVTFVTLIVEVRGWGEGLVTVWITEMGPDAGIELSISKERLQVPIAEITGSDRLFPCDFQRVSRIVTMKLLWTASEALWISDGSRGQAFSVKEQQSKFLNDDFLTEVFQILSFQLVGVERTKVEGVMVKVEVLAHKKTIRLRLSIEEKVVELDSGSPDLNFLTSLQALDLFTARSTLLSSLEFKVLVKRLVKT